jgi:hypothetical protein
VLFGLYNELVIFDHVDKTIRVVANANSKGMSLHRRASAESLYNDASVALRNRAASVAPSISKLGEIDTRRDLRIALHQQLSRDQFEDAVRKGKEYIQRRRHLSVRAEPAAARAATRSRSTSTARCDHQPVAVHVYLKSPRAR